MLAIPNLPLEESAGGSVIYAVMTGCDVTYTLLFPDGTPRRATVSLTFRQIVQRQKVVFFKGHTKQYNLDPSAEGMAPGGGRPTNSILDSGDI
jgi:hypothetical protein